MKEGEASRNILAIESAVADGSIAIISEGSGRNIKREGAGCSRAEKIVSVIASVLDEAGMTLQDLHLIAVSIGPGSYSGIRIGMATAIGLGNALEIPCLGVSVLESMANGSRVSEPVVAAVPVGKTDVAWQAFEVGKDGVRTPIHEPQLSSYLTFVNDLERLPGAVLLAQTELLTRELPATTVFVDAGIGLAEFVGRFAASRNEPDDSLRPIYLRNRDAAVRRGAF